MSDAVTALGAMEFSGPAVQVKEAPLRGMITVRGDLSGSAFAGAVRAATGCDMPQPREIVHGGDASVGWMSPDELLLLVPHDSTAAVVADLSRDLAGVHHLAVDVSDARAVLCVEGTGAREVLARLCPADLSPAALGPGELRRTRLAQIPAAFWIDPAGGITLVCFRSVARYTFDVVSDAANAAPVEFLPG